jgi:flagellar assembly protein FliH
MSGIPSVKISGPIEMVKVLQSPTIVFDVASGKNQQSDFDPSALAEIELQKQAYTQAAQIAETIAAKLQVVYEKAIIEHRQGIAKLAVEIARKILAKKVSESDYQIESIIKEAMNNAPTRQDVIVRLNPKDLDVCQKIQQQGEGAFANIKFLADSSIGPAQCIIETSRGKIEALIDEQLEQVARVLNKTV